MSAAAKEFAALPFASLLHVTVDRMTRRDNPIADGCHTHGSIFFIDSCLATLAVEGGIV